MSVSPSEAILGRVASLHLHPTVSGTPMQAVDRIEVEAEKGIVGNRRYFNRRSRSTGAPTKRQVTVIEREQIAEHAVALGLEAIEPGAVRSNIETFGIRLMPLIGRQIRIGSAVLYLAAPRDPCAKMDAICPGLRELMLEDRQGVLAQVVRSGVIRAGDEIVLVELLPQTEAQLGPAPL